jgi:predicted amidohydrolase
LDEDARAVSGPAAWNLAACQYPVTFLADLASYRRKIESLVSEAATAGARLLLFPEYGAMELASLLASREPQDLRRQLDALQDLLPDFLNVFSTLARDHRVHILAPSVPVRVAGGAFRNRAHLVTPDGRIAFQDKLMMTRFEAERLGISAGHELKVFATELGQIGVNICYDVEFPPLARAQSQAGADLILVPSCTDQLSGHSRVWIGARARALENQCIVAVSPAIGEAPWSAAIDRNVGAAGIFVPPDHGFSEDGMLARGHLNAFGWIYAAIDRQALARLREDPEVFIRRDWHTRATWKGDVVCERL